MRSAKKPNQRAKARSEQPAGPSRRAAERPPVAIVGIGGLFPQSPTLDDFWRNIAGCIDTAREIPEGRWPFQPAAVYDPRPGAADKVYSLRGCFIAELPELPYFEGLNIRPEFVEQLDPLFRILLHCGHQAFQDGVTANLDRRRTGVIIGNLALPSEKSSALAWEYLGETFREQLFAEYRKAHGIANPEADEAPAEAISIASAQADAYRQSQKINPLNRYVAGLPASILGRALQLGGVCHTLDAACASSLYALKLAVDELQSGRADAMLTGGLSRPDCLYTQMGFSQLRALSPAGVCSPFDVKGNGLVVGEGCGILLLKRLDDAVRDGDRIYAVIRGIGLSNDVGGSLLAPLSEGQLRAMRAAYAQAGLDPRDVDLIECHATGTPVGDAVEFESLKTLWAQAEELRVANSKLQQSAQDHEFVLDESSDSQFANNSEVPIPNPGPQAQKCVIGSVKSNIGHLLTAAGAAAIIKTLLALKQRQLPPTANFETAAAAIQLEQSPFEVLRAPRDWPQRDENTPRRAAVSAFGFGGINAHVLLEEFLLPDEITNSKSQITKDASEAASFRNLPFAVCNSPQEPIAIVGMAAHFGPWDNLRKFQERVLGGRGGDDPRIRPAWRGAERSAWFHAGGFDRIEPKGYFIDELSVGLDRYRIPPKELEELLPQQLLMLEVAAGAMRDAGQSAANRQGGGERTGVFIGLGLDANTTNFNCRWQIRRRAQDWAQSLGLQSSESELDEWVGRLCAASGPQLTANRTMGALGSIVASRIGREFHCGGPCFTLSNEDNSGMQALAAAARALREGALDLALAGAVDLNSDLRSILAARSGRAYSPDGVCRPFDETANGAVPGEGAAALVLKRLGDALRDGNRIYALIGGCGTAAGSDAEAGLPDAQACKVSAERALAEAGIAPGALQYIETNGSGDPREDRLEAEALAELFGAATHEDFRVALGSVKADIGHTGAASGLAGLVKAALCLYQEILPPLRGIENPLTALQQPDSERSGPFAFEQRPQFWLRNNADGPRRALVTNFSIDGSCAHVVLEGHEAGDAASEDPACRLQPLGTRAEGLFALEANNVSALLVGLNRLKTFLDHQTDLPVETLARRWWNENRQDSQKALALALVARSPDELNRQIEYARRSLTADPEKRLARPNGDVLEPFARDRVFYSPQPLGRKGRIAFVFPGSGNHFSGMGRGIGVEWPELLRAQDRENKFLRSQFQPQFTWGAATDEQLNRNHKAAIFGQVALGTVYSDLIQSLGVRPRAVIGYSLGETTGLFALKAWTDRDEMLRRMNASTLFTSDLVGEMNVVRKVWRLPANKTVDWAVGVINRPVKVVRATLKDYKKTFTLIVNTLQECVIGGYKPEIDRLVRKLECEFFPLDGISTVHCQIAEEVAEPYRELHLFPTVEPSGVMFYSGARGASYHVNRESAADSILAQAIHGIDYPKVIEAAWSDEIRIFLEMGPGASCSRMIGEILKDRPFLARSFCVAGQDDVSLVLRGLAALIAERAPVDLSVLYGQETEVVEHQPRRAAAANALRVPIGAPPFEIPLPPASNGEGEEWFDEPQAEFPVVRDTSGNFMNTRLPQSGGEDSAETVAPAESFMRRQTDRAPIAAGAQFAEEISARQSAGGGIDRAAALQHAAAVGATGAAGNMPSGFDFPRNAFDPLALRDPLVRQLHQLQTQQAQAHAAYLHYAEQMNHTLARTLQIQMNAIESAMKQSDPQIAIHDSKTLNPIPYTRNPKPETRNPLFDRTQCLELAIGSAGKILGAQFAEVDTFPTRVRLPDEPLMLVDRIVSLSGAPRSMTGGGVITEHDVLPGVWYLDGGRIPTCIAVESGQADLFLSGWLGIDFITRGLAVYRLLDATVTFHGPLPRPGETIRYDIKIDHFFQHGPTWFFRFEFDGTVNGRPLITMRNGCAGFFTQAELDAGQGIMRSAMQQKAQPGILPPDWKTFAPPVQEKEAYSDTQLAELRRGNLAGCFGTAFANLPLADPLRLPDGLMNLVDRVIELDPNGGRFGLGVIRAEMDIRPDDWFLTCHFSDDQVMPGTLMYECCLHTLRIFLLRLGWVGEQGEVVCEPVCEIASQLKCRGQVIASTKKVLYEVEIRELGEQPDGTPFAIADALMYADGKPIVDITNMCVRLSGLTREKLRKYWNNKSETRNTKYETNPNIEIRNPEPETRNPKPETRVQQSAPRAEYTLEQITAYTEGDAAACFGEKFRPLQEQGKYIALLPREPYQFLHRVEQVEAQPWIMRSGGTIDGHFELRHGDWHFAANRQDELCYAILLEAVLQPCGFFSAFMGSAFLCDKPLYYRNLGGSATQYRSIPQPHAPARADYATHVKCTQVANTAEMSIQHFEFGMTCGGEKVYAGKTYFGFFTADALKDQVGLRDAKLFLPLDTAQTAALRTTQTSNKRQNGDSAITAQTKTPAVSPDLPSTVNGQLSAVLSAPPFPDKTLRMIDRVELFSLDGGPHGLGFVRGTKLIDPAEWFFQAHFKGDPVWPGSLGIEAFVQLLKLYAYRRWNGTPAAQFSDPLSGAPHSWSYRGQVSAKNKIVTVDAYIKAVDDKTQILSADGYLLADGLPIYEMTNYELRMKRD